MIDETDLAILELLKQNARLQWKEIGHHVHLTGQAVGARIRKMEELGILEGYTVRTNPAKLGLTQTAFVTVIMSSPNFGKFQAWLHDQSCVVEAHRVSGEGCYLLKVIVATQEDLAAFLDQLLEYGKYKVNQSIQAVKR